MSIFVGLVLEPGSTMVNKAIAAAMIIKYMIMLRFQLIFMRKAPIDCSYQYNTKQASKRKRRMKLALCPGWRFALFYLLL
jgi:hypothetical protein